MKEFFQAGGWSMWLVLIFGGIALVSAILFARRPDPARVPMLKAMSRTTVFAVLSGMASNFTAVMWTVGRRDEWWKDGQAPRVIMQGLGEAVTPATLGFTFLSLAWLFVAIGSRRIQARGA